MTRTAARPVDSGQRKAPPKRGRSGGGERRSVAVVVRLERAVLADADIGRLVGAQLRQLGADLVEVEPRDLLVEVLRQGVDLALVLALVRVELELRKRLVRE